MTVNEIFSTIRDWATGKFQPRGDYASTDDLSGKLDTDGDSADNTVSFTSEDIASPTGWTDVPILKSGEKHSGILHKISVMFKNIRYFWQLLGSTDISAIGNGTVTGAIDTINSNLDDFMPLSGGKLTEGGIISPYGDLYMKSNGYDGWLSRIMDYIKSERNIKTYTTLEQIGLTEPATAAEIYAAMPTNSQALLINGDVTGLPTSSTGITILFVKHNAHRGFILATGKTSMTYIMHLNDTNGNPTGTWVKLVEDDFTSYDITTDNCQYIKAGVLKIFKYNHILCFEATGLQMSLPVIPENTTLKIFDYPGKFACHEADIQIFTIFGGYSGLSLYTNDDGVYVCSISRKDALDSAWCRINGISILKT